MRRLVSLIILPVFSGLLLLLSFPEINLGFLAWIALVPLLLAIHNRSWRTAFGQGFLAGLVFYAGSLSWVVNAMQLYGHVPFTVSYVVMLLLAAYRRRFGSLPLATVGLAMLGVVSPPVPGPLRPELFGLVCFAALLFGWWGIPWGPIWTIGSLVTNLRGGRDITREVLQALPARAS